MKISKILLATLVVSAVACTQKNGIKTSTPIETKKDTTCQKVEPPSVPLYPTSNDPCPACGMG